MRRVVVTGLGMVSPIGNTVEESWNNALAGKSGIGVITQFDASSFGSRIAGEVKNFEVEKYLPAKEARRFDRFIQLGIAAAVQALDDSGLTFEGEGAERAGCAIGSGIGGLPIICQNYQSYMERGERRISPFLIPGAIANMVSGQLSIMRNLQGPSLAYSTACTTGLHSIGEAAWMIRRGDADVMAVLKVRFVRWALAALTICMLCPAETTIRQRHPVRSIKTATALCWAKDPVFWFLKTMNMPRNAAPRFMPRSSATVFLPMLITLRLRVPKVRCAA